MIVGTVGSLSTMVSRNGTWIIRLYCTELYFYPLSILLAHVSTFLHCKRQFIVKDCTKCNLNHNIKHGSCATLLRSPSLSCEVHGRIYVGCWLKFLQVSTKDGDSGVIWQFCCLFLRKLHMDFYSGCNSAHFHQQGTMAALSPHPCWHFWSFVFLMIVILMGGDGMLM